MLKKHFETSLYLKELKLPHLLRRNLLQEAYRTREYDHEGRVWSQKNYLSGYTSYSSSQQSLDRLYQVSSNVEALKKRIDREVMVYAKLLGFTLKPNELEMSTCWVNIMGEHCYHGLHIHPHSVISGTYYVQVPKGSGAIQFEDPRMDLMMAAPMRKVGMVQAIQPKNDQLVLFESWLRHEVKPNQSQQDRISISFNYDLK